MNMHAESSSKKSEDASRQRGKNPYILLVDDDKDMREMNAAILMQSGYRVDTAEDGASGWKAFESNDYDLLVTDNNMPRVTGLELIKKIRAEEMATPVVLASGTLPADELAQYPWLRLDAILPKPYTVNQLLETVNRVLNEQENAD
jgi:DNA-binding response OmpR family regulator